MMQNTHSAAEKRLARLLAQLLSTTPPAYDHPTGERSKVDLFYAGTATQDRRDSPLPE